MATSETREELITGFRLETGGTTEWGVPIADNNRFHTLTTEQNPAFIGTERSGWNTAVYYQPDSGGVAVIFDPGRDITRFETPSVTSPVLEASGLRAKSPLILGEAPGTDDPNYQLGWGQAANKHLGYLVLARTE